MPLELRAFNRSSDFAAYRDLFGLSFPETENTAVSTDAHYRWKFESVPAVPPSYEFAALENGRLVGYYAALPYRYSFRGTQLLCGMVCDVMTHPDMRGKGIFTRIGRFATERLELEGVDFVSGYPIRPEVLPGHLKVGWSVAFREPVYVRPLRANALLKDRPWAKPLVPLINAGLDVCNSLARPRGRSGYSVEVLSREDFLADDGYEGFFAKWAAEQRNYLVKDRSFVAWRTGAPGATYRFVKLSVNGEWAGLAIVRSTNLKGVPALAVLDLMVPSGHVGGLEDLHHALVGLARREGREVVAAMMSPTRASAYRLARSLYLRTPAVFSVIFKALRSDLQQGGFGAEADWHLMWIDSDDL